VHSFDDQTKKDKYYFLTLFSYGWIEERGFMSRFLKENNEEISGTD